MRFSLFERTSRDFLPNLSAGDVRRAHKNIRGEWFGDHVDDDITDQSDILARRAVDEDHQHADETLRQAMALDK